MHHRVSMSELFDVLVLHRQHTSYTCTTLRGWIKGTTLSLYTANHKEYRTPVLVVPIWVVRCH